MPTTPCKLSKNIQSYLSSASKDIGAWAEDAFDSNTHWEISDLNISSPIEQLLYIALKRLRIYEMEEDDVGFDKDNNPFLIGLHIVPQEKIGKYRVDFKIAKGYTKVIVECDGHEWHERNESQRRYEKERDRFLQGEGYSILHYTGKEITDDPDHIASEIYNFIIKGVKNGR